MPRQEKSSQIVILLVDGEVMARNRAAKQLNQEGYTVLAAAHGKEALELSRTYNGRIDLLIAEMEPKVDAIGLCEAMAAERPDIRTCAISASPSDGERAAAHQVPFLLKPLDPELLQRHFPDFLI